MVTEHLLPMEKEVEQSHWTKNIKCSTSCVYGHLTAQIFMSETTPTFTPFEQDMGTELRNSLWTRFQPFYLEIVIEKIRKLGFLLQCEFWVYANMRVGSTFGQLEWMNKYFKFEESYCL